ncbi:MAG: Transcriptional regulator, TetR family [uncultured Thiotrichaceae bacterium]|uniref:Transcriptional regulator, TetR family n=1 Tax=uncultured Thiotrichaceae bacterium TaxID=298394 RepID=A0A6S6SFW7_9GAMM|nr:MAG: Transcriptional regulator, TetR family [uncultured Thiotrichaceae bacterium]
MSPRIVSTEEKEQKRKDILDTAARLWEKHPETIVNMSELAKATGIAKGSLYLHFRSKEDIFLSLHERHVHQFFNELMQKSTKSDAMTTDDVVFLVHDYIAKSPSFLPLATLAHGMLERQVPLDMGIEFKERISGHLQETVDALQKHFPALTIMLMTQSYALMLGLWQLLRPTALNDLVRERELFCAEDYFVLLENGLHALWSSAASLENLS